MLTVTRYHQHTVGFVGERIIPLAGLLGCTCAAVAEHGSKAERRLGVGMPPATGTAGARAVSARPATTAAWPLRPGVVIALATVLGFGLRAFQLSRPGYLTGFTQYDDGVYIGNALRLVNGVIPYRDFAMVQPPGSMLLMVPAALLGKAFGSAWGLAAGRILTLGADTANVALVGLLVRHRGALAAGVASGGYAVYPAALNASQSLFLEPWLNLFCLLGALLLFDGDQLAGQRAQGVQGVQGVQGIRGRRSRAGSRRPAWAGVCFGFAAAVKIWAVVPALVALALCLARRVPRGVRGDGSPAPGVRGDGSPARRVRGDGSPARRVRGDGSARTGGSGGVVPPRLALPFACGFAAGIVVPCLPFLVLAPSGFGRTVFVSELLQATHGRVGSTPRWADITGIAGLSGLGVSPHVWAGLAAAAVLFVFVLTAWLLASRSGYPATALDWFALLSTAAVTVMLFSPSEWYEHYAAFAGPFLVVLVALSAARLVAAGTDPQARRAYGAGAAVAVIAVLAIAAMGAADGYAATKLYPARDLAAAAALIPPGACVLTDTASVTIVIDRFSARSPGCPALVDAVGTLIATTDGKDFVAGPAALVGDTGAWQAAFQHADYVWLIGNAGYTGARIAWTPALYAYFVRHFRLIGLAGSFRGSGDIPGGGLYVRRGLPAQ
jgi:alpha-1,2-mannosyltransferase